MTLLPLIEAPAAGAGLATGVLPPLPGDCLGLRDRPAPLAQREPGMGDRRGGSIHWVWNTLHYIRASLDIFSWDWGNELQNLTGRPFSQAVKESEAVRYIQDCLSINPYITDVRQISVDFGGSPCPSAVSSIPSMGRWMLMPLDFDELLQEATPESLRAAMMARPGGKGAGRGHPGGLLHRPALCGGGLSDLAGAGLSPHPAGCGGAPARSPGPTWIALGRCTACPAPRATTAFVRLTFTGDDGVTIPAGTVAVSTGGLRFATDLDVTISGGTAEVTATAEAPGEQYNVAAGTVTRLTSNSAASTP